VCASVAGSGAGEGGVEPPIRFAGDELDLYAEYHFELVKKIVRDVQYVGHENAEDACAHAWLKVLQRQPDRGGERWKGWLYVTAKREAWKLNALEFKEREDLPTSGTPDIVEPIDPRDRLSERVEFQAALQELKKLPPMLHEVVVVRSQVWKQADVAEAMGLSRQRVGEMLVNAALRVSQLNEERHEDERPVASPRAARLRELEDEPPVWLTNAVGMRPGRSKSSSGVVLAWRRAALMIDDYRRMCCYDAATDAIGPTPTDPEARRFHQRAERAITEVADERLRRSRGMAGATEPEFGGGRRLSGRRAPAPASGSRYGQ
jgi:hypothetical protein